jgi:hypothetical protein
MQWCTGREIKLQLDCPSIVIALLPDLASEYPLVEPLESLLMRALRIHEPQLNEARAVLRGLEDATLIRRYRVQAERR